MTDLNKLKRIRWHDGLIAPGNRWYGVTEPLRRDKPRDTSFVFLEKWSDIREVTPEALSIVHELYSMKGITGVWVATFGIDLQKTPVFCWDDYHADIVALLNTTLFRGTADVGELGYRSSARNTDEID